MFAQAIVLSGPAKILAIGTGNFRNNGTQTGTGGTAQIVLLDSSNTVVASAVAAGVSVPGSASFATEHFISQGVLGKPPGTDATLPAGSYTLKLDFAANGICGANAEAAFVDRAVLSYLTVGQ